jgi:hypothetical protein
MIEGPDDWVAHENRRAGWRCPESSRPSTWLRQASNSKTDLLPEAGVAVYVRGARGKLTAARIYDDVEPATRLTTTGKEAPRWTTRRREPPAWRAQWVERFDPREPDASVTGH